MLLASEATADGVNGRCDEAPHWSFIVDVTVENSMTAPPGTACEHDPYQGPMVLSTMSVDERAGAKYHARQLLRPRRTVRRAFERGELRQSVCTAS